MFRIGHESVTGPTQDVPATSRDGSAAGGREYGSAVMLLPIAIGFHSVLVR
jgi:hypothetical protein